MSFSEFSKDDFAAIETAHQELTELVHKRCKNQREYDIVEKAFQFANEAHKNVRRRSGEPYMLHPIEVAKIVIVEIGLGYKAITAALLHDVVEDTEYTVDDIKDLFGEKIATLVDGLTKIKTVLDNEDQRGNSTIHTESLQAENFKRILLTLGDDVRVVLIKLADRLHNCRTIEYMPEHKRDKILSETMFIFIPLAHRLGLYGVKSEMENIWLKYKEPDAYRDIMKRVSQTVESTDADIDRFIEPIKQKLEESGLHFIIKKRVKTPYSIWYKMKTKAVEFEQIYDLYAVRIIFDLGGNHTEDERRKAYDIYVSITDIYREQPGRTRDWIKQPKSNGYEALHCTLMSNSGMWVEVQIRSKRMDDIAEKGIAAHWVYKQDGYISENDSEMDKWLAKVKDILMSEDVNDLELLDIIHRDLVSSEIVVFTPKGDQKVIQNGATALDFAYSIHTRIGERAIAAKVNMKLVPLQQVLKAGDQVEIITAENAKPKMEWLKFLETRHAKQLVISYFREHRNEISAKGETMFNERLRLMGEESSNEVIKKFLEYTQLSDKTELFFRVGLGIVGPEDFPKVLNGQTIVQNQSSILKISAQSSGERKYIMAECCNPIPGDPVIGFQSGAETIIIHKKSCAIAEGLASKFGNRVVVPQWQLMEREYPIRLSIKGIDRVGLLSDITQIISLSMGINIRKLQLGSDAGVFQGYLELLVKDKKNLENLMESLHKVNGVQDVLRTDI